jgi:glycosyltransferase involved in cell wall biosynthesis
MAAKINVLYYDSGQGIGGSRNSLIELLRQLNSSVRAHIVGSFPSELVSLFPPETVIISGGPRWASQQQPSFGRVITTLRYVCHLIGWSFWFSWMIYRHRIDLVHANNEPTSNAPLILAAWICRRPCVCHLRGTMPPMRETRWLYRKVDHYIAISDCVRRSYEDRGLIPRSVSSSGDVAAEHYRTRSSAKRISARAASKCSIIYNSIDVSLLEGASCRNNRSNNHPLVVSMIGRIFPFKGQDLFLDVAAKVFGDRTDVTFQAHGPIPEPDSAYWQYYQMLCRKADDLKIGTMFCFPGAYTNVERIMQQTDIILCCSPIDNFGRILFEAMACGVPVIAFDAGGIHEVGVSETNCIIVPNRDTTTMALAVTKLLSCPALREHLAFNGSETARRLFDGRRNWQPVLQIYTNLLGRN